MRTARPPKPKQNPLTRYICDPCRKAKREGATHPGVRHTPGICDCPCRD